MQDLEQIGTRAFFRPRGQVNLEQGIELIAAAIRAARGLGMTSMLVDTTRLTGFGIPDVFGRYVVGSTLAAAAGSQFGLAMVVRPELVDPQKIGALVAQNRNAVADVFTSEPEALAWLDTVASRLARRPIDANDGERN